MKSKFQSPWARVHSHYQRNIAHWFFKRPLAIRTPVPLISFSFDDFPRTALSIGGEILRKHGAAGTYYTSLGIMGTNGPSGPLFVAHDLTTLLDQGHELGCHTFAHCHSWNTRATVFEESVVQNQAALAKLIPGAEFKSLSYPISEPQPSIKRRAGQHFQCCRGGGQTLNSGMADLNQLLAFFLEKSQGRVQSVKDL